MKSNFSTKYPVFEADQVLSQKHLNNITSYLEEQDRITRVGAIGIGIVCGMKISNPRDTIIKIGCGTAITSLGYQIQWEEQVFTHYWEDELSQHFLQPDLSQEPYLNAIYQYVAPYASLKNCKELLPETSDIPTKIQLTEAFLQNKMIILLLEASLINQKNCLTTNCDDKGKRMEFKVRPLIVDIEEVENILLNHILHPIGKPISIGRLNVPKKNLKSGADLMTAYNDMIEESLQKEIAAKSKYLAQCFKSLSATVKDFDALLEIADIMEKAVEKNSRRLHFQYVWDWLRDLAAAYNEILHYYTLHCRTLCCANEALFPFHILLGFADSTKGKANQLAKPLLSQRIRTPWIPVADRCSSDEMQALILLLNRFTSIIKNFEVPDYAKTPVRIIPGLFGKYQLSEKNIPYYYANVAELVHYWNPQKSRVGLHDSQLSYFASRYTTSDEVLNPLHYDLEAYNYFRIEGHIGNNYQEVLKSILDQQQNYQLPFRVIALNATELLKNRSSLSNANIEWTDLELDYDLVRRDYENIIGKSKSWLLKNKERIEKYFDKKRKNEFDLYIQLLELARKSMQDNFVDFLPIYEEFIETYESIENISTFHREHIFELLQRAGSKNDNSENFLMEDVIDHLDAVINVCQKGEFRALYQAALDKWQTVHLNMTMGEYAKKHPGMEHIAGVTKGGTFIIVYQDRRRSKPKRPATIVASNDFVASANTASTEAIAGLTTGALASATPIVNKAKKSSSDSCDDKMNELVTSMSSFVSNYFSSEHAKALIAYIADYTNYERPTDDELSDALPSQLVIADFYLPYICCSEGDNITMNIISPKPQGPSTSGDFSANDFNNSDFNTK
jgi:hypothetical protein